MPLLTPTTSTAGRGTITVQYLRQETEQVETAYGERTNRADIYQFTATPAAGWQFVKWNLTATVDEGLRVGTEDEYHETVTYQDSALGTPFETDGLSSVTRARQIIEIYGTGRYRPTWKTLTYHVEAVFSRPATNLLVNSFNKSSPVQLVYDPATNLLVADF